VAFALALSSSSSSSSPTLARAVPEQTHVHSHTANACSDRSHIHADDASPLPLCSARSQTRFVGALSVLSRKCVAEEGERERERERERELPRHSDAARARAQGAESEGGDSRRPGLAAPARLVPGRPARGPPFRRTRRREGRALPSKNCLLLAVWRRPAARAPPHPGTPWDVPSPQAPRYLRDRRAEEPGEREREKETPACLHRCPPPPPRPLR
jgi:hypothetical protein